MMEREARLAQIDNLRLQQELKANGSLCQTLIAKQQASAEELNRLWVEKEVTLTCDTEQVNQVKKMKHLADVGKK